MQSKAIATQDLATEIGGAPDLILLQDPLGPLQRQPLIGEQNQNQPQTNLKPALLWNPKIRLPCKDS